MKPINLFSANTQIKTEPFVAMKKCAETVDGLNHQFIHEEYLHQIEAHMTFTMEEHPLYSLLYYQWHKKA